MGTTVQLVNLAQTAFNAAATVVAAEVAAGLVTDAPTALKELKEAIFKDLTEVYNSQPTARDSGRERQSPRADLEPGDVVIKMKGKHEGHTIAFVQDTDPTYLDWYIRSGRNEWLKEVMRRFRSKLSATPTSVPTDDVTAAASASPEDGGYF